MEYRYLVELSDWNEYISYIFIKVDFSNISSNDVLKKDVLNLLRGLNYKVIAIIMELIESPSENNINHIKEYNLHDYLVIDDFYFYINNNYSITNIEPSYDDLKNMTEELFEFLLKKWIDELEDEINFKYTSNLIEYAKQNYKKDIINAKIQSIIE